jgi:acyl carrier protein
MVDSANYEERVLALIAEAVPARLRKPKITTDMRLQRDLGLDSIGMLALLFRFEQAFGIDIAALDVGITLGQMKTVGDAVALGRDVVERASRAAGGR